MTLGFMKKHIDHGQWKEQRRNGFVDVAHLGTVLGVWAHPDDEAYMSAGLMFSATSSGQRVVVATATKGELGTSDPQAWPPHRLARARERETAQSLAMVGVREHYWLGHHDGRLHLVPPAHGVSQVANLIEHIRPDTIITFGPDGMTGHRDHQTVSDWTTTAWLNAGRPGRLWYATVTPEFHRTWGAVNEEIGFWFDGSSPPSDPASELAFVVNCSAEVLDRKFAALSAHRTQTTELITLFGPEKYRRWWATEAFVDASRRLDERQVA
jgi:LmbE family N-acetylglucosaminyl deacetylase